MKKIQLIAKSENETKIIAKAIGKLIGCGDLLLLDGDLGTGKTFFVKAFAKSVGSSDIVTSPTYNIANFYSTKTSTDLLHIDLYRLSLSEFRHLGLLDYFSESIVIIEWGGKIADDFENYISINFQYDDKKDKGRKITLDYKGEKYVQTFNLLNQKILNFKL